MEGFGLLVGHLLGDFCLQNDWQAANKTNPHPGTWPPAGQVFAGESGVPTSARYVWRVKYDKWLIGHLSCTIHCLLYTLAVWACSFWWMPWWGLLICSLAHWPIDRFRLAKSWMEHVSGQKAFATGPLAPWSVIVVDQCFHLLTLFLIGIIAR